MERKFLPLHCKRERKFPEKKKKDNNKTVKTMINKVLGQVQSSVNNLSQETPKGEVVIRRRITRYEDEVQEAVFAKDLKEGETFEDVILECNNKYQGDSTHRNERWEAAYAQTPEEIYIAGIMRAVFVLKSEMEHADNRSDKGFISELANVIECEASSLGDYYGVNGQRTL